MTRRRAENLQKRGCTTPTPSAPSPDQGVSEVHFELVNEGGSPVRVVAVESGCGCAKPKVEPDRVLPGALATVSVRVQPLEVGERRIPITLRTDSQTSPIVPLEVRRTGRLRPPYLFRAGGELVWNWEDEPSSGVREAVIETIEPADRSAPPEPRSDLSFLKIGSPSVSELPYAYDAKLVGRVYRFPVRLDPTPETAFDGHVDVADPWNPGRTLAIRAHGQPNPPLQVSPPRLLLSLSSPDDHKTVDRLLVRMRDPRGELQLEVASGTPPPLVIEPVSSSESGRVSVFEVRVASGAILTAGIQKLVARTSSPHPAEVIIPVMVKIAEEEP